MTGGRAEMILRGSGIAIAGCLLATMGCDRSQQAATPAPANAAAAPAVAPVVATAPATTTASTQPLATHIQINDRMVVFPPARLRIESDGQHLVALLFTDDP